jgi:hypothetical protein
MRCCDLCGAREAEFTITSKHLAIMLPELEKYYSPKTSHITKHICTKCFKKIFRKNKRFFLT